MCVVIHQLFYLLNLKNFFNKSDDSFCIIPCITVGLWCQELDSNILGPDNTPPLFLSSAAKKSVSILAILIA